MGTGFLFTDENALSQKRHYIKMYLKKKSTTTFISLLWNLHFPHWLNTAIMNTRQKDSNVGLTTV
jgi:hypothetical protein